MGQIALLSPGRTVPAEMSSGACSDPWTAAQESGAALSNSLLLSPPFRSRVGGRGWTPSLSVALWSA